ncbi:PDR/VanB family oxidoreductase [Oceanibacterium hippocampi]|uniref:Phthalate 4,5-dioxygenase oxygenase reductase subunit n=1 Tax=Oceanibacterium hippocampi TaxID=745714 RepID=A0A1Y5TXB5_9PROT|nr:PDR/VanB family oxidoreductase [Oceanibacterium hippocampi]SLN75756.1 Phthalate 4,5-dioxygenase oxygenase reductase subunit [Oceanibacterium hippocampi]
MNETDGMAAPAGGELTPVLVTEKRIAANDVCVMRLALPNGPPMLPFTPGAHIPVRTPSGAMRTYSLANDPAERDHYEIGVKIEREGRGGSLSMAEKLDAGDMLEIGAPRNDFELVPAGRYLFIAGGIGITPIMSMCRSLRRRGDVEFRLIYCTRSPAETAFLDVVGENWLAERTLLHHDRGDPAAIYDFWPELETADDRHVYCCGPKPMLEDIRDMSGHWPVHQVHFEDFLPVVAVREGDREFTVELSRSGRVITIPADRSVLETLRDAGLDLRSSCESGTCGTCRTRVVSGEPEHRDLVLTDQERKNSMMICVSRARGGKLVLDL